MSLYGELVEKGIERGARAAGYLAALFFAGGVLLGIAAGWLIFR